MAINNYLPVAEILNNIYSGSALSGYSSAAEILNAVYDTGSSAIKVNVTNLETAFNATSSNDILEYLDSVISIYNNATGTPVTGSLLSTGSRYIATTSSFGWTEDNIYTWTGDTWTEYETKHGDATIVSSTAKVYTYSGSVPTGVWTVEPAVPVYRLTPSAYAIQGVGVVTYNTAATASFSASTGREYFYTLVCPEYYVKLPSTTGYAGPGREFIIHNKNASAGPLHIMSSDGTAMVDIKPGEGYRFVCQHPTGTNNTPTAWAVENVLDINTTDKVQFRYTNSGSLIIGSGSNTDTSFNSLVTGEANTNSARYSAIFGAHNTNTDAGSTVSGYGNNNSGQYASVSGYNNTNSGKYAYVSGKSNSNIGPSSRIIGYQNANDGLNSSISGQYNINSGSNSIVGGSNNINKVATYSVLSGNYNYNEGIGSTVSGYSNKNSGAHSILGGYSNDNSGSRSLIVGTSNKLESTATNSSIIAGTNITGTAASTAYATNIEARNNSAALKFISLTCTASNYGISTGYENTLTYTSSSLGAAYTIDELSGATGIAFNGVDLTSVFIVGGIAYISHAGGSSTFTIGEVTYKSGNTTVTAAGGNITPEITLPGTAQYMTVTITTGSNAAIIGGNNVQNIKTNSVCLGMTDFTASADNTTYIDKLNVTNYSENLIISGTLIFTSSANMIEPYGIISLQGPKTNTINSETYQSILVGTNNVLGYRSANVIIAGSGNIITGSSNTVLFIGGTNTATAGIQAFIAASNCSGSHTGNVFVGTTYKNSTETYMTHVEKLKAYTSIEITGSAAATGSFITTDATTGARYKIYVDGGLLTCSLA